MAGELLLEDGSALLERDVLIVVTELCFVLGVKIGSGSFWDSLRPSGSLMPQTVPFS